MLKKFGSVVSDGCHGVATMSNPNNHPNNGCNVYMAVTAAATSSAAQMKMPLTAPIQSDADTDPSVACFLMKWEHRRPIRLCPTDALWSCRLVDSGSSTGWLSGTAGYAGRPSGSCSF